MILLRLLSSPRRFTAQVNAINAVVDKNGNQMVTLSDDSAYGQGSPTTWLHSRQHPQLAGAIGNDQATVALWDAHTGQFLKTLSFPMGWLWSLHSVMMVLHWLAAVMKMERLCSGIYKLVTI
ncbi:MAG: hypothetical protein HGA19_22255 [Oscillochloris sp.]|nr:hypothetical protein [Oscillochloris sp.]